jgi:ribonuclease P protein component
VPRHGQTAVARNTVKRRLREIVRVERIGRRRAGAPADLVVVALPHAYHVPFTTLRAELLDLCDRADQ